VALALLVWVPTGRSVPIAAAQGAPAAERADLLERVKANLRRERKLLLEFTYREKRRPMKVSALGKVSVEAERTFAVHPSSDPDRPNRELIAIGGRPATAQEREEFAREQADRLGRTPEERRERERRDAEARRKAQARLEDAFRVYTFEDQGVETRDGRTLRVVRVIPRPHAETRSDVGKWMKKFRGTAWVSDADAELVRLEMTATDSISLGWGIIGRIAEGTHLTYTRRLTASGVWFPATARFQARGRTLIFRSFEVDTTTEWFDYRPVATSESRMR
jgi:hypothetical protein